MVTAIVLAAGESRRMGRLKPLLSFGRRSVIETVVTSLQACPIDEILVVTGHRGAEIAAALNSSGARIVPNPDFDEGMLSSIRQGVAAADPRSEWLLLALGDQPTVPAEVVRRLLDAGIAGGPGAYIPLYGERRGHPILLHASLRQEIGALPAEGGLRELWRQRPESVHHVPVHHEAVLQDMDTPEDYERLRPREE